MKIYGFTNGQLIVRILPAAPFSKTLTKIQNMTEESKNFKAPLLRKIRSKAPGVTLSELKELTSEGFELYKNDQEKTKEDLQEYVENRAIFLSKKKKEIKAPKFFKTLHGYNEDNTTYLIKIGCTTKQCKESKEFEELTSNILDIVIKNNVKYISDLLAEDYDDEHVIYTKIQEVNNIITENIDIIALEYLEPDLSDQDIDSRACIFDDGKEAVVMKYSLNSKNLDGTKKQTYHIASGTAINLILDHIHICKPLCITSEDMPTSLEELIYKEAFNACSATLSFEQKTKLAKEAIQSLYDTQVLKRQSLFINEDNEPYKRSVHSTLIYYDIVVKDFITV